MNTIVEFKRKPEAADQQHMAGEAHCIACSFEWAGSAPVGTVWLECPKCSSQKGLFRLHGERSGEHWTCACGNQLFYIMREGAYCPNCGDWQAW